MYNIIDHAPLAKKLSSDNIAEFVVPENSKWINRQTCMYKIKQECTRQGLRNGMDYVFLNNVKSHEDFKSIKIHFEDESYVTYMTMWYELNKEQL